MNAQLSLLHLHVNISSFLSSLLIFADSTNFVCKRVTIQRLFVRT